MLRREIRKTIAEKKTRKDINRKSKRHNLIANIIQIAGKRTRKAIANKTKGKKQKNKNYKVYQLNLKTGDNNHCGSHWNLG